MFFVILGCIAFGFLYIFDLNKLKWRTPYGGMLFFIGCAMLFAASVGAFFSAKPQFVLPLPFLIIFSGISVVTLLLMLWALFFSLPFSRTYVSGTSGGVVDTGLYAMCRHPGVIFFGIMYICLWLVSGRVAMLAAAISWTAMDVLHVYVQDQWFFPKTLEGYELYRLKVPFLIPNTVSLRKGFKTLRGREA